jgi:CBS domain-containing protein
MLKVRDVMTRDVVTLSPAATLREAAETLAAHHVSGAPVVDGGKPVGVLSLTDILDLLASTPPTPAERTDALDWKAMVEDPPGWLGEAEAQGTYFSELWPDAGPDTYERIVTSQAREWDQLSAHVVAEGMSRALRWVGPEVDVVVAADTMQRARVHRLLVLEHGRLVGVISTMDVTRAVAEHRLVTRRYVFDRHGGEDERAAES